MLLISLQYDAPHPKIRGLYFRKRLRGKKGRFSPFWTPQNPIFSCFWPNSSPNIFTSTCRMKMAKVCNYKVFTNFWSFRKFWKKGLFGPRTHPNPNEIFEIFDRKKWKFLFFQKLDLWVWGCSGSEKPFFSKFSETSKFFKYFTYLHHFHTISTPGDIDGRK